jgi:ATP-binding cassette, subfamily A (ABC1), member 3
MAGRKSAFWIQVRALTNKDWIILLQRHFTSTLYTALLLPILLTIYLGIGQNLQGANNNYGIIEPTTVRSLEEALDSSSGRSNIVFVTNDIDGDDVGGVVDAVEQRIERANSGTIVHRVSSTEQMSRICKVSFQGTTSCYGAVVFNDAPSSGEGGSWNYTLFGDVDLGRSFDHEEDNNDPQIYILPLQRAVDAAIARVEDPQADVSYFESMQEMIFTNLTESERDAEANRDYQKTFINYMGVAILLAFFGLPYHLPGYIATEREKGLSALIDSMMTTKSAWEPQAVRMVAYFTSFSTTYFSGWVGGAVILKFMIWKETSVGIVLPYMILFGLAATAQALIGGTLFKKAQLSGVANGLVFILLGVLIQAVDVNTAGAAILGLLFTPCNMVLMIKYMARYESQGFGANLLDAPDDSDHNLPAIALWMFLLTQIVVSPMIAAWMERWLHGVAADSRIFWTDAGTTPRPEDPVVVRGLTKTYRPSILGRLFGFGRTTTAVSNLDLAIPRGQIVVLLGANGSGKSTTLDAIAGIQGFSKGSVTVDGSGGFGIAPQKNVMWDELTVREHIRLFNSLKSPFKQAHDGEIQRLLKDVELVVKRDAKSATLSGGQKRKLQLAMMLTGDSSVCCIDEVSSGIDPLARRKIWDILLRERGKRTIIFTTHFLDEAETLSDNVVIMSKGKLRAVGSAAGLKAELGSGYRIHLSRTEGQARLPEVEGVMVKFKTQEIIYIAPTSDLAAHTIRALEDVGIGYRLSNPTLEDVFLQAAEEYTRDAGAGIKRFDTIPLLNDYSDKQPLDLASGRQISMLRQALVLMYKRLILLKNNWLPYVIAFLIPVVAAAVMQLLVADEERTTCTPVGTADFDTFNDALSNATIIAGPESAASAASSFLDDINRTGLDMFSDFSYSNLETAVESRRGIIKPGGFFSGPENNVVIYRADEDFMPSAVISQNLLDAVRTGINIVTSYSFFDTAFGAVGKTLQLSIYFSIALGLAPSFMALYPNLERRTNVRGLQYSSGVRVLSQWGSHLAFDFLILLIPVVAAALIFTFTSSVFWNPGYLIPVFLLYTIAGILSGYIISLILGSQLATWAAITAFNGVGVAIYFISFLFIINLSDATAAQANIHIAHYIIALVFPIGSMIRAMLVSLNVFSQACDGGDFISYAGSINAYGAPILYLALQSSLYFCILLISESKTKLFSNPTKKPASDPEKAPLNDAGVQVQGLTKNFGTFTAVDDVSFDIAHSEVFALLGPNGAGKSTTISLIRGDLHPTKGDVLVSQISVTQNRALARANMGVCPQFDALDSMTTTEHLQHYARLRGIKDIPRQVDAVISAVGLQDFRDTMAHHLSGGNKRKLSLGMALTGNPNVILLDEPSSGLDAAAKRIMWHTLKSVMPGRSILLTTHSMEEADALAQRAGIVAKNVLAMGRVDDLQKAFGDSLHVHLVSKSAPHSSEEEMEVMREGVLELLPGAVIDEKTYHGQMRFSIPVEAVTNGKEQSAIGRSLVVLEDNKEKLGISHHSIAPTTLNDVFLTIVGQHNVAEEGYQGNKTGKKGGRNWRKVLLGF